MKNDQTIIRKNHMEPLHFITKLLDIKDLNIQFMDVVNRDTHKEILAKLDYEVPAWTDCGRLMRKYNFQKPSNIFTLKRLACLLESSLESVVSSAIIVRKCQSLRFLSSRRNIKFLVIFIKRLLRSWLKRRL